MRKFLKRRKRWSREAIVGRLKMKVVLLRKAAREEAAPAQDEDRVATAHSDIDSRVRAKSA